MDTSQGACRLSWSRLRLHTKNASMPRYAWDVRDECMAWSADGRTLALTLAEPLCDGFRVRVEWSALRSRAGGCTPLPEERELGASYVVVILAKSRGAEVPVAARLGSMPLEGELGVRRDLTIELYPDQPLASFHPSDFSVQVAGVEVPFHIHTNRNPPDWIYLQLERLLPVNAEVLVRVSARALTTTLGAVATEDWCLRFRTGSADPALAVPHMDWSEPSDGLTQYPCARIEAALRFNGAPMLDDAARLQQRISLVELASGRRLDGLAIDVDPTPAHYRTIFIRSNKKFDGMRPNTEYALRWNGLGWPGFDADKPGQLRFRTQSVDEPAIFLAGCPHVSFVATETGTELQVAVQVYADEPIVEAWVALANGEWRAELSAMRSPNFRDMVDGDARVTAPVLWTTLGARPTLNPVDAPQTRHLEILLRDAAGRERRFAALGFDMTVHAIQQLVVNQGAVPSARWALGTPCDSQHVSIHDENGKTYFGGLFDASTRAFQLPPGWALPPGRYLFQLWLLRATPEDDLWDFAVADRWFEVPPHVPAAARLTNRDL